jgi:GT2 family glycosyltransferase
MLHIILPVHNRSAITARFIDALISQAIADYRLLVVDDGCTDDTIDIVRRRLPGDKLIVLKGDGNLWWAGALQRAYEYLRGQTPRALDAVLVINDDVSFTPDFLSSGLAVLAANPGACVQAVGLDAQGRIVDRGTVADVARLLFRTAQPGEVPNCLSTRGLLMDASTFVRSGGFRPRWLPHYLSDYEFTLRLRRQGVRLLVDERFSLQASFDLTGLDAPVASGARQFWAAAFSNRAKFNPKHWSAFVVMVCPPHLIPLHLLRVWISFSRALVGSATKGGRLYEGS